MNALSFQARYYQENAAQAVIDYYLDGNWKRNALIAMPTGTGKSVVISLLIKKIIQRWPTTRFAKVTHVKELIAQNAEKFHSILPGYDLGIYSAGLKQRNFNQQFIFGGVASMVKNPLLFGHRDVAIVDEAHLISGNDDTNYGRLFEAWRNINPNMIVVGLTATKYRMGQGLLTNGMFDDIVYDDTTLDRFNTLIREGYLSMLVAPHQDVHIDIKGLKKNSTGEFVQAELEERAMRVTADALNVASQYKHNRFSWLVFASGVKHAYQSVEILNRLGITATVVHSNSKEYPLSDDERDRRIKDFKAGKYQAMVNYGVLTTGFDHPPIDLIVMLRATDSVPLWVQMLGRGTRVFHGDHLFPRKQNCLCLDFARNTLRLGPINDPYIPNPKGKGGGGDPPVKICTSCGNYNHISARFCTMCGSAFEIAEKITYNASQAELIVNAEPKIERYKVKRVFINSHVGRTSGNPYLSVSYDCDELLVPISENVFIEGQGRARTHAENWWAQRSSEPCPLTVQEAAYKQSWLRAPKYIDVQTNLKYPVIVRCEYE